MFKKHVILKDALLFKKFSDFLQSKILSTISSTFCRKTHPFGVFKPAFTGLFCQKNKQMIMTLNNIKNEVAKKIDGTAIAKSFNEKIKAEIIEKQSKYPEFRPSLAIIQVGSREESNTYIRMKRKASEEVS